MRHLRRTALSVAAAQVAVLWNSGAFAQDTPAPAALAPAAPASAASSDKKEGRKEPEAPQQVIVTGQRRALETAQSIKQNADEVVDSIVADEAGKLPDRSIAEVLQRISGVTIDRVGDRGDPQHFSVEGTGVTVRGLSYVRSELNGRDAFSSNGGRTLSFADVPPELMSGVDVYKNPSAEQIEGGLAGVINLRTAMPFDFKGLHGAVSVKETRSTLRGKTVPDASGLISDRWDTDFGQLGALLDVAHSENKVRTDGIQAAPYFPRTDIEPGKTLWVPQNGAWRREDYDHSRNGVYGALQWKKNDLQSALTFFDSKHDEKWVEVAQWSDNDPYKSVFDDAVYNANGVFQSGTISNPSNGGVQFYNNTKVQTQTSETKDLSWNLTWKASDRWALKSDLQFVRANSVSHNASVDIGAKLPSMGLDVTGSTPRLTFDDADRAAMLDPANSYWNSMSYAEGKGDGREKAWRGDAEYTFDDPVLRNLRFGLRLTNREATPRVANMWAAITPSWAAGDSWQPLSSVAMLSDPRFAQPVSTVSFKNFFNGNATTPPSLLVPTVSAMQNYGATYAQFAQFPFVQASDGSTLCKPGEAPASCSFGYVPFTPALLDLPVNKNTQNEKTTAAYSSLRFAFDDWRFPVEGNIGMRLVQTRMVAHGYLVFTPATGTLPPGVPPMTAVAHAEDYSNSYTNVLPSINLKLSATPQLQFRFAASQGIARPDFSQLQAYETLSQSAQTDSSTGTPVLKGVTYSGTASGNPMLKPTQGNNFDLTAEWYPSHSSSLTLALFDKELKDIVVQQTYLRTLNDDAGQPHNFVVTGPTNGAKGSVRGLELGLQTYFDKLPGLLSGIGVSGNYTYIDSTYLLYNRVNSKWCSGLSPTDPNNFDALINGCDTDGRAIGGLPMPYLSRNAFNLALLYDKGPVSARVAYSWRGRYLQAVNANGYRGGNGTDTNPDSPNFGQTNIGYSLPVWAQGYGTVDGSVSLKFTDALSISLEGQNLTNTIFRQTVQQHVGTQGVMWFATGPRYTVSATYSF